jgi:hypothetical protein
MVVAWAFFFIQRRGSWLMGVPVESVRMGSVAVILKILLDVLPSFASWSAWLLDWLLLWAFTLIHSIWRLFCRMVF